MSNLTGLERILLTIIGGVSLVLVVGVLYVMNGHSEKLPPTPSELLQTTIKAITDVVVIDKGETK